MAEPLAQPAASEEASPPRGDARLRAAWQAVEGPGVSVVSTDIFDTLLWRQVAEPSAAFRVLAQRLRRRGALAAHLSDGAFENYRRLAEHQARMQRARSDNDLEATLEEIYANLPAWIFCDEDGHALALESELAVERDLLVPDLDVVALLSAAVERGKRVVAVSDTYFSEPQLRALLDQPVVRDLEIERIYSSSEYRRSKVDGLLEVMLEDVGVPAAAVVHLGDHPDADVAPAKRLGLGAVHFERHPEELVALLERERRFADPDDAPAPGLQAELTALRGKVAARAEAGDLPPALRPFWSTGAVVLGPVLTGFAEWVQERAAEHRLSRLFCFMREGEFLVDLVDRAGQSLELPARGERLWLNREVLAAAALADSSRAELESMLVRRRTPSVAEFLRSVGLSLADVPRYASHGDTGLDDHVVRETLFGLLEEDPALNARVVEHARAQRERVVRYVESLIGDDDVMGVVDLGWGATAQRLLRQVMWSAGRPLEVVGLYLVTHEGVMPAVSAGGMHVRGYLGEVGAPERAVRTITRTPEILEQLCMPDHGPQIRIDEDLQPVLAPAAHDRVQMAEAAALRDGVKSFQREWARYRVALPGKLPSLSGAGAVLRPLLVRQLEAPTELEATLFGSWAHDENQGSSGAEEIADLRHAGRLRHLAPEQLAKVPMEELYWPAGLAARSDPALAELAAAAAAGVVPWSSLASPVESGTFTIEGAGVDVDPGSAIRGVPTRNRLGLSEVFGTIAAPALNELIIRPSEGPAVLRLDYLHLRCRAQGEHDPIVVDLEAPADFQRLVRINCFVLNPNVFVMHSHAPELRLDLSSITPRTIFRVDVRCGFALLPISQLLPTPGRLRSVEEAGVRVEALERELAGVRSSLSWRLTRPLRLLQRLAR